MDTYLMMLYVSLEQETALKQFFLQNGWQYCRPDLSIVTDNIGPHVEQVPHFVEKFTEADYTPSKVKAKKHRATKPRKRKAEQIEQRKASEADSENTGEFNDNDTFEEVHSDTDEFIPEIKMEVASGEDDHEYADNVNNEPDNSPEDDGINDNVNTDPDYSPEDGLIVEMSGSSAGVSTSVRIQNTDGSIVEVPISQANTPLPPSAKKKKTVQKKIAQKTPNISMIDGEVGTSTTKVVKRKHPRKQYNREDMYKACVAVKEGMPLRRAARTFNIPVSTLLDRKAGRVSLDCDHIGVDSLLSELEESELVSHINQMTDIGHGYLINEVRQIGREFALSLGKSVKSKKDKLTSEWFARFKNKWLDLRISKGRKVPPTEVELVNYFRELGTLYTDNDLLDHPERIFTLNETKLDVVNTEPTENGTENKKLNVTVIASGNALGNQVPPYYVFPGKEWDDNLLQDAYTGTDGEMTEDGCSNSGVLHNYLTNHFANHIPLSQETDGYKTIILLDVRNSSRLICIKRWADLNNIVLFVLPPRSEHLPIPIDVNMYEEFKKMYSLEYKLNKGYSGDFVVTRNNIAKFTARPYAETMSAENLASAFREAGIYPLNDKVVTP